MKKLSLAIEGMSCGHCVRAVTGALQAIPGVTVDTVAIGSAELRFDPAVTAEAAIAAAVTAEGYRATEVVAP
ncbi:MAG: cation transporter [Gemmatimonadaceae bacterium]|nr:cation transporter [Gemmatimonadaceae bacterium]